MAAFQLNRFGRSKTGKKRRRLVLSVRPIPTMVTLGNLVCGFAAIILATRTTNPPEGWTGTQCLYWAGLLLFFGMIFDVFDGQVARWTKSESKFGLEMDSLCDVVSFGVAPAVLVYGALELASPHLWGSLFAYPLPYQYFWLMLSIYVACAAMRLARYNVEAASGHVGFFYGIPSPAAAGCIGGLVLLLTTILDQIENNGGQDWSRWPFSLIDPVTAAQILLIALPILTLSLGILMVTRVRYIHIGDKMFKSRRGFLTFLVLGISVVIVFMQHKLLLAVVFNGYMLVGVVNEIWLRVFKKEAFPDEKSPAQLGDGEPAEASGKVVRLEDEEENDEDDEEFEEDEADEDEALQKDESASRRMA